MSKAVVMAGWDDVPHLSAAERERLLATCPPHLREARSKGIPVIGSGAIYPLAIEDITCAPFQIPRSWPRAYGFDVGWKATAAIWGAWDRQNDCVYLYREYKRGQAEPSVHTTTIMGAGKELYGAIDPASRGRSQADGTKLMESYGQLGLNLTMAKNAVEDGLFSCWERYSTGRLKIFSTLVQTIGELRLYRRDDKGRVVKENDHLMDAKRYLIHTLDDVMQWTTEEPEDTESRRGRGGERAWMSA